MADRHVVLAAKGGGIVFGGRLFVWAARFGLAVLLVRLLGADAYGLYTVAVSIATLGAAFAVIGLDSALIRYMAVYSRRADRAGLLGTLRVGLGLPLLASAVAAIAIVALAGPIARDIVGDPRMEAPIRIIAILVPAMVLNSVLAASLQGAHRIGWAVVAEQFAQPIVRFAVLLAFAVIGMTAEFALLGLLLATLAATALLIWFLHRHVSLTGITGDDVRAAPGEMLRFSAPVYFSNLVNTFGGNLQTILLGGMASIASAGIFTVASQVMLVGSIFHSAIVQASMPIFAELQDARERGRLHALYRTTSKWTFTLNLPFFLVAVLFPQALLSIFGPEFLEGATALVILACASVINAGTGTSGAVLDMTGHTRMKLINSSLAVGLAIALNLFLIPEFGITGAAIATLGSVATVNLLRVVEVGWLVRVGPYDLSWAKPLLAGAVAAAVGWMVAMLAQATGLLISSALGAAALGLTYAGLLVVLGLSDDDRIVVTRATRKFTRRRGGSSGGVGRAEAQGEST